MLSPGTVLLNRYQIIQPIGGGGMGDVYLAYDLRLGNQLVVVKENRGGDPQLFYAEATILAQLRHPNLPRVIDHFVEAATGAQYLVMDYIAGQNLEQVVQARGALAERDALAWLNQILNAVKYLHANRIVHRDIKPQNIILTPQGNAVLVDFGIAKLMQPGRATASAARGVGSPGFAPLEQYTGGTDERSDIYALGTTFYFALTGVEPPPAPDRANGAPLVAIRARNPNVSPTMEMVVATAAAVVSSQRYPNVDALQSALRNPNLATNPVQPPSPPRVAPPRAVSSAPTWVWAVGGAGALLVVGLVLFVMRPAPTSTPTPAPPTKASMFEPTGAPSTRTLTPAPTQTPFVVTAAPIRTPTPTATPLVSLTPRAGETRVIGGAEMVYVPAGEFTMGSNDGSSDEKPPYTVYLDAFWIDRYEVTNALYKKCVEARQCSAPSSTKSSTRDSYYGNSQYDNYPVIYVSWNDANAFCSWTGKRLPTEAEWEKAARGTDARVYPWGNTFDGAKVNSWDSSPRVGDTTEVGRYPSGASPYGALDMAGNVWEWVADWYDPGYYANSPRNNPKGPTAGQSRVLRGGSWGNFQINVRVSSRNNDAPGNRFNSVGFRCAQ